MDVIDAWGMIFPMPCASIAAKTINGHDNYNIKQMTIMFNKKNSVMQLLQVHNKIRAQDRSKNFMPFVWMPLMHEW